MRRVRVRRSHEQGARGRRCALRVLCVLGLATLPLAAQESSREERTEEGGEAPVYGKTPHDVIPYRAFQEPYRQFFDSVVEFRGTGRGENKENEADEVRIGFMGPLGEAPDADLGQQMLDGVRLALEQANATGGYKGKAYKLIVRPDMGLWGATSNEMASFRWEDDALAVIGSIDGANTHIALRVALKTQTVMVNTGDTDPTLTETNIPWLIRTIADDRQQGYALAHHIFREIGLKRVVAFRVNDRYGRVGIAEFRDAARRLKRPLRMELRWTRGDRDFTAALDRIAQLKPDGIVLWGNAYDAAAVVREIRRRRREDPESTLPGRIFGCDRLASATFLKEAGSDANGVVAAATFDPTGGDPAYLKFVEAFGERFGHDPDAYAAHGYDGAKVLIGAIEEAGMNRIRIRDVLYGLGHYEGVTGPIEFDTTLNDVGPVFLATVEGGRLVYRPAAFRKAAAAQPVDKPYRALAASPPVLRAPARARREETGSYRIGAFFPLDDAGRSALRGLQMAMADDAARHGDDRAIELVYRDARGAWGSGASGLNELVFDEDVLAVIGSTERRGTHLAAMLAAKFHFPLVVLHGGDPSVTAIPLPWVFVVGTSAPAWDSHFSERFERRYGEAPDASAVAGFDAAALVGSRIRDGGADRISLREGLALGRWHIGVSGTFRFDRLGNRVDCVDGGDPCEGEVLACDRGPRKGLPGVLRADVVETGPE